MREFEVWLEELSAEPLPGGVAAAAIAAAMGTALVAKATRITLRRQILDSAGRAGLQSVLDLANHQSAGLMRLADVDERAYRAVLDAQSMPPSSPSQTEAWLEATEVPLRLAEICHALLEKSSPALDICWPAVQPDLQVGLWLLETGTRAGLAAAENNLCVSDNESFRLRLDALK